MSKTKKPKNRKTVYVESKDGAGYKVVSKKLVNGATLSKMYACGNGWVPSYEDKLIMVLLDTGNDLKFKFYNSESKVTTLDFSQAASLRALIEVLHRTSGHDWFDPLKISKIV